jgi:hypothetical protein
VRTAAEQLGIDRRKLYQLCERFGIELEAYRTDLPTEGRVIVGNAGDPCATSGR